ncbi:MAG: SapC family protein [Saccharospirillaceae bacterium]|nr:SapC family protein [Pseudomonadales bacterium]NRB81232.1 SapC family protein [Saccharospirillaceae bacterium]
MSSLIFYSEPTALNRETHKDLTFTPSTDYSFTKNINSVPLTGIEFFEASRDIPILFSQDPEGNYFPIALLSLMNESHTFLNEDGSWKEAYTPAFIRRYPFVLTDEGTVCFDAKAPHFKADEDEKANTLFDEKGENSESLKNAVQFLNAFEAQHKQTTEFCKSLKELDLFKPLNIKVNTENTGKLTLNGMFSIDEEKLTNLDDEIIVKWFKSGWIAWSYAHLHSIGALKRLLKRQDK